MSITLQTHFESVKQANIHFKEHYESTTDTTIQESIPKQGKQKGRSKL